MLPKSYGYKLKYLFLIVIALSVSTQISLAGDNVMKSSCNSALEGGEWTDIGSKKNLTTNLTFKKGHFVGCYDPDGSNIKISSGAYYFDYFSPFTPAWISYANPSIRQCKVYADKCKQDGMPFIYEAYCTKAGKPAYSPVQLCPGKTICDKGKCIKKVDPPPKLPDLVVEKIYGVSYSNDCVNSYYFKVCNKGTVALDKEFVIKVVANSVPLQVIYDFAKYPPLKAGECTDVINPAQLSIFNFNIGLDTTTEVEVILDKDDSVKEISEANNKLSGSVYSGKGYIKDSTDPNSFCEVCNSYKWTSVETGIKDYILDIWGTDSNNIYVVGDNGLIAHYDGTSWSTMDNTAFFTIYGVWGSEQGELFTVGGPSSFLYYDGSTFTHIGDALPYIYSFYDVWGSSSSDVFAVGQYGGIIHYNGTNWVAMASPTKAQMLRLWGLSNQSLYAVGSEGTLLHYDGVQWNIVPVPTEYSLHGVWGSSESNIYVVGDKGVILHYNGNSWQSMDSGTNHRLFDVFAGPMGQLFAVGDLGILLRYYDNTWETMIPGGDIEKQLWASWSNFKDSTYAVGKDGLVLKLQYCSDFFNK